MISFPRADGAPRAAPLPSRVFNLVDVRQRASPGWDDPGAVTLVEFFERLYRPLRLLGRSASTTHAYRRVIRGLAKFLRRDATVADLRDEILADCLDHMLKSGRAPNTVKLHRALLVCLANLAARKRLVPEFVELPRVPTYHHLPVAWHPDQFQAILDALSRRAFLRQPPTVAGIPWRDWWLSLLLTLYDTALRISAALQLRTADIDLDRGVLTVPAEFQKQRREQRFTLDPQTVEVIRATMHTERELLFPCPWSGHSSLSRVYGRIVKAAGLPAGPKRLFHCIRRTSATLTAAAECKPCGPFAPADHSTGGAWSGVGIETGPTQETAIERAGRDSRTPDAK
jgi:integrase